ncbi:MAG TPA: YidC/Oxa1 family insertase periplasmic-domain containing protein [Candidatus Angelobacter sp.]|jgi:YidC/Oxa1 family membrane protein insertase|nr:YidC/Oxa1 family insertase periplasmic-domain containing protein [Candidatus Angelobacter sp.]
MLKDHLIVGSIFIGLIVTIFLYFNPILQEKKKSLYKKRDREIVFYKLFWKKDPSSINRKTILENDVLKIEVSNIGVKIYCIELKKFKYDKKHLMLSKEKSFLFDLYISLLSKKESTINTCYLNFTPKLKEERDYLQLSFKSNVLEYVYIFRKKIHYGIDLYMRSKGKIKHVDINWRQKLFNLENEENPSTKIFYSFGLKKRKIYFFRGYRKKCLPYANWFAFKQKFFASILSTKKTLKKIHIESQSLKKKSFLKYFCIKSTLDSKENEINFSAMLYFSPLDFNFLKHIGGNLEKIIPFGCGILKCINKYFFLSIFKILENAPINYGLIIILITLLMKVVLFPIIYKQYKFNLIMNIIQTELDQNSLKKQQDIYREIGISPISGVISSFLQLTIFYSLLIFFPNLLNLRGKSFLWVEDLTYYDSILELPFRIPVYGNHVSFLTFISALVFFVYTYYSNISRTDFITYYGLYILMLLFINNSASALSLYYIMANIINIFFLFFIKHFIFLDENKIRKKINLKIF